MNQTVRTSRLLFCSRQGRYRAQKFQPHQQAHEDEMRATNVVLMRGLHRRVSSGVHQTRVINSAIDADSRGVLRHFESEARDRPEKVIFVREAPIRTGGVNESETQERIRA